MAHASEADQYLLDQIAAGNAAAWSQVVERYQGRLLAFARSRLPQRDEAADLVQETFLAFLQTWPTFRPGASLETYLFTILRRRLIDQFRGRRVEACTLGACTLGDSNGRDPVAPDPGPVGRAQRDERAEVLEAAIANGLDGMVRGLRDGRRFGDLRLAELLFYAQLRNRDVAARCGMSEPQVAQFKFRALAQIRGHAAAALPAGRRPTPIADVRWEDGDAADSMLTRVWERLRPTCPKRSTLGRLLLGTLDEAWRHHLEFHLQQLGCRLCLANWDDLRSEPLTGTGQEADRIRDRIFQSTVGFLAVTR